MGLKLYNTYSRIKENFIPLKKNQVKMYTCGPTVYNYVTIANHRAYIVADILRRYFEYQQYKIKHVMNLTDVDDKTIKHSQEQNTKLKDFTKIYIDAFMENLHELNIIPPTKIVRATDCIKDMIKLIQILLDKKIAYTGQDGSVYFSIVKFPEYGKLAKLDKAGMKIGFRVSHQEYDKEQAADFVLWKARTPEDGDNFWPSPFGEGRPGWSIECSAMSMKHLGETFDIHTGGIDLIFPHHENEIAQSKGATGKDFVKYWVHHEHMLVNGQRMGKSLKNFYTIQDIKDEKYTPRDLRYLYLCCHYRTKMNFTWDSLQASANVLRNIDNFIIRLGNVKKEVPNIPANSYESLFNSTVTQFQEAIDDDLNTPKAIAVIHNLIKKINILLDENKIGKRAAQKTIEMISDFDKILGVLIEKIEKIPAKITKLAKEREKARLAKDYKKSDELRKEINKAGYDIEDTSFGFQVIKK